MVKVKSVERRNAGSASILLGNVYSLSCFVSGPDENWTYSEKLSIIKLVKESQTWLQHEAQKYVHHVQFEGGMFGMDLDIKLPFIERGNATGNESWDWVTTVLSKIGYKSPLDLYDWVKTETSSENLHVLIFVKGEGHGYAISYINGMNKKKYFVEGAILYERFKSGEKLAASFIAHEILHLYGAWDLYKTFKQSYENERRAKELFPYSIMHRTSYNINELYVDEVTAWLIGWNSEPKDWYEWFSY